MKKILSFSAIAAIIIALIYVFIINQDPFADPTGKLKSRNEGGTQAVVQPIGSDTKYCNCPGETLHEDVLIDHHVDYKLKDTKEFTCEKLKATTCAYDIRNYGEIIEVKSDLYKVKSGAKTYMTCKAQANTFKKGDIVDFELNGDCAENLKKY